ncbi:MAG: NAD-dependent epimerase/dehydratase family protein [Methanoregula sp.]|nr:NAD-dependent epimerase/dehydratase family protein [Methanoregula sp.]
MKNKTLFVTGGSGFIGRNIIEYFRDTVTVIAPTHAQVDLLSQDAVDRFFREHDIDYVIHCANIGGNRKCPGPNDSVGRNMRIFFNLLGNSRHFEKLIHFGSGAEYDKRRPLSQVTETAFGKRIPADDYGFSKYLMSQYIEKTENSVCLRLFGVFGKYEDYEYKFISNALVKNLLKMPISIRQNVYFDWLYIHDLMKIVGHFIDHDSPYRAYNTTPGKPLDLVAIAGLINENSPIQSEIIVETPGLNNEYSGNNERLLNQVGSFQFTPLPQAISELRGYYSSILSRIDPDAIQRDEYARYCSVQTSK